MRNLARAWLPGDARPGVSQSGIVDWAEHGTSRIVQESCRARLAAGAGGRQPRVRRRPAGDRPDDDLAGDEGAQSRALIERAGIDKLSSVFRTNRPSGSQGRPRQVREPEEEEGKHETRAQKSTARRARSTSKATRRAYGRCATKLGSPVPSTAATSHCAAPAPYSSAAHRCVPALCRSPAGRSGSRTWRLTWCSASPPLAPDASRSGTPRRWFMPPWRRSTTTLSASGGRWSWRAATGSAPPACWGSAGRRSGGE